MTVFVHHDSHLSLFLIHHYWDVSQACLAVQGALRKSISRLPQPSASRRMVTFPSRWKETEGFGTQYSTPLLDARCIQALMAPKECDVVCCVVQDNLQEKPLLLADSSNAATVKEWTRMDKKTRNITKETSQFTLCHHFRSQNRRRAVEEVRDNLQRDYAREETVVGRGVPYFHTLAW